MGNNCCGNRIRRTPARPRTQSLSNAQHRHFARGRKDSNLAFNSSVLQPQSADPSLSLLEKLKSKLPESTKSDPQPDDKPESLLETVEETSLLEANLACGEELTKDQRRQILSVFDKNPESKEELIGVTDAFVHLGRNHAQKCELVITTLKCYFVAPENLGDVRFSLEMTDLRLIGVLGSRDTVVLVSYKDPKTVYHTIFQSSHMEDVLKSIEIAYFDLMGRFIPAITKSSLADLQYADPIHQNLDRPDLDSLFVRFGCIGEMLVREVQIGTEKCSFPNASKAVISDKAVYLLTSTAKVVRKFPIPDLEVSPEVPEIHLRTKTGLEVYHLPVLCIQTVASVQQSVIP